MRLRATKLSAIGFGGSRAALPSLDLAFALDKALTARKGPTPTFTRGSGATQVNASGLIEYAPENLVPHSNNIVNAAWTKEGGTAASSIETVNGLTAEVFNENTANSTHRFYRLNDGLAGITSTFSVWLKAAGRRYVCVNLGSNGPTANSKPVIDLVDRVVVAGVAGVTINIQLEANGWARYSFTFVPRNDSGTMPIQSNFSSTALSEIGVGLNGAAFYVAGQQYERASTARAYMLTTTAAAYGPRFDHDPVTLACKGLLIEESRTNLVLQSEDFSTTWAVQGTATITNNQTNSPAGTLTADLLTTPSGILNRVAQNGTAVASTTYSATCFVKSGNVNGLTFRVFFGGGNPVDTYADFIFASGTFTSVVGAGVFSAQAVGNGWYRITCVIASGNNNTWSIRISGLITTAQTGTTSFLWGAQLEADSFPTSYIPTTGTALQRSADVCSISGADFTSFYNQSEGTFFGDATPQAANQLVVVVGANTSASTASHFIYKSNNLINAVGKRWAAQTVSTGAQTAIATGTDVAISASKLSYAYKLNDFAFAYAGSIVGTDSSGTIPTPTTMRIGCRDDGLQINGHIARIQYFKKRLPNAKLQSLTTA